MNKAERNPHLQFTTDIWKTEENSPTPDKEERVQIVTNDKFPFLDIKMSCSPEGDLSFVFFRKKGEQLEYVGKEITHTPSTLYVIPSGSLNRLTKFTSRKPSIHSEGVDTI